MAGKPELLILGAGPAGCAAALSYRELAADAWIVILDGGQRRPWRAGETLAAPARQLLRDLGCWERFAAAGFRECHGTRSLTDDRHPGQHRGVFQTDAGGGGRCPGVTV